MLKISHCSTKLLRSNTMIKKKEKDKDGIEKAKKLVGNVLRVWLLLLWISLAYINIMLCLLIGDYCPLVKFLPKIQIGLTGFSLDIQSRVGMGNRDIGE